MPCAAPLSASRLCASVASGPPAKNRPRKLHSPTPAAAYDTIYRPNSMRHGSQTAPEASESPPPSSRSLTTRSKREVLEKQTEEGRLCLYVPGARGRKFRSLRRRARGRTVRPAAAAPRARWSSSPSSNNFLPLPRIATRRILKDGCPPPASRCRLSPDMVCPPSPYPTERLHLPSSHSAAPE
ncbi:hypothetical protein B0H14DRAFT_440937 [Mycena olivaceomarginata]|nr:hypothetical protein B0H14DRAFT_440937 [Mycena olivaceomarginata]